VNPDRTIDWRKQPHKFWRNETYFVSAVLKEDNEIGLISIRRHDWKPCSDWRDKQAIKNQILGPEWEAAELYPAESRVQDQGNWYHLQVMPKGKQFPFGFLETRSSDKPAWPNEEQRPLEQGGDLTPLEYVGDIGFWQETTRNK
jgi:hypothetical protein